MDPDLPEVGMVLRNKKSGQYVTVVEVFPGPGYHGMIVDFPGGRRGQAFTTRDWRLRWEVMGRHGTNTTQTATEE